MGKITVFLLLLLLCIPILQAMEFHRIEYQFQIKRTGIEVPDSSGTNGAVWSRSAGVLLPSRIRSDSFFFVSGISLEILSYYYDGSRAVLTEVEWRELTVLVPQIEGTLRWKVFAGEKTSYFVETGLEGSFPIPLKSWNQADSSGEIVPSIYSSLAFVKPVASVMIDTPFIDPLRFLVRVSVYAPLCNLWTDYGTSLMDGFVIGVSGGFRIR